MYGSDRVRVVYWERGKGKRGMGNGTRGMGGEEKRGKMERGKGGGRKC